MDKRTFDRQLFGVINAFTSNAPNYEQLMDNLTVDCTDEQWQHVCDTLDMVHDSLFLKGELPPETVIPDDYCDWGHGGVER